MGFNKERAINMSKQINSPSSNYSSIRNRKSASPNLGYGFTFGSNTTFYLYWITNYK